MIIFLRPTLLAVSIVAAAFSVVVFGEVDTAQTIRVPATVEGKKVADLYAKLGGFLKSVSVDIGDQVAEGQVLAQIDVPEMEKQLAQKNAALVLAKAKAAQAHAKLEEARAHLVALKASIQQAQTMRSQKQAMVDYERKEYQRISQLAGRGAVQQSLVDAAQFKLQAAESEVQTNEAKVAMAKANLSGGESAVVRAEADVAASEAGVAVAQADIEYVTELMNYSTIRAPWAGKITQRMVDPGAFVQSAAGNSSAKPLLSLVDDETVIVSFSVSQKLVSQLNKGTKIRFGDIDALPHKSFEGKVTRFSAQMDPETRLMRVEVELPNSDSLLKPGFFGYATVIGE